KDMFWLQDIVPNHMAFHADNWRLMDVFERGALSPYYHYFDIDWDHPLPELHGKVMAPLLGKTLQDCVAEQEIGVDYTSDGFVVRYFDNIWPLSLPGYTLLERQIRERDRNHPAAAIIAKMVPAAEGADYETWRTSRAEFLHALTQLPEQQ